MSGKRNESSIDEMIPNNSLAADNIDSLAAGVSNLVQHVRTEKETEGLVNSCGKFNYGDVHKRRPRKSRNF